MSIASALSAATTGLSTASKRAALSSNNIANALTPGYSKREIELSEIRIGRSGGGVQIVGTSRNTDPAITAERRGSEASLNFQSKVHGTYAEFSSALGEPEDPFSLFAKFANLESSLRSLSQTPESQAAQTTVVDSARALSQNLNELSSLAQQRRQDADAAIKAEVDVVNNALKEIARLNTQISVGRSGAVDVTALEDERHKLIDQVAERIPVREINPSRHYD